MALATGGLAAVLAMVGMVAAIATEEGRILALAPVAPPLVLFSCLLAAFALAELALLHVELRRQAYSFSLSGIALLLGVLFYDVEMLVLARIGGAVLAFAWQQLPPLKVAYNLSAYTLETALVGYSLHWILGSEVELTITVAAACYLVFALVDVLMSSLVLLVICWHQGRIAVRQVTDVLGTASVLGLFSTLAALAITQLLANGVLGVVLIIGLATLTAVLYRGYLGLRHRHQSLALMHEFVEQSVCAGTVEEMAEVLLARTRRLLNAGEVELTVYRAEADLLLQIDEDGLFSAQRIGPRGPSDWLLTRVYQNAEAMVVPRNTRERGLRHWLISHRARDAMIVPLPSGGIEGVLIVKDRMGETTSFTADDLTVVQTLAGHLAVALRGAQLVQQLRHDATHDALTGLANRVLLAERIEQALHRDPMTVAAGETTAGAVAGGSAAATGELVEAGAPLLSGSGEAPQHGTATTAVLLLDLDKFKEVNDALGHHVGDALLRVVGARIHTCVPPHATVARLGGDEFAVLLPPIPLESGGCPREEAVRVARSVLGALISPIVLPEAVVSTRGSIGIALGAPGFNGGDLLRHADTAMYAAKAGENPIVVYTEDLDHGRAERLNMLADLAVALEHDQLELRYQPQLQLGTNTVVSLEALVRWRHPVRGLLSPDEFIPLAESSGLIGALTLQVLRKALQQCRRWRDQGLDLAVAVNLSAYSVNDASLADLVAAALVENGLPADRLVLEITESSVMGDPHRTVPILQRLADIGITLSLDDFGTGYSSLAYLQRLPVSEVKIDKSFVMGMTGDTEARASSVLVRSILTLGENLGLRVVAEGVEDLEVLELLRGLGCDLAQGYLIARPLAAEEVPGLVAAYNCETEQEVGLAAVIGPSGTDPSAVDQVESGPFSPTQRAAARSSRRA